MNLSPTPSVAACSVALDGPAGVGKSTLAKMLAARLGLSYVDTGAMYRAVALRALETGLKLTDAPALEALAQELPIRFETCGAAGGIENRVFLEDREITREIRSQRVSEAASVLSAHPPVRRALVSRQQALAREGRGVVMEGRDIGTVVLPRAEVKFYLVAGAEVRAERRYRELLGNGENTTLEQVLHDTVARDERDSTRADSPLQRAPDALEVNTSNLSPQELVDQLVALIEQRLGGALPGGPG